MVSVTACGSSAMSVEEFLKQPAFNLVISGSYRLPNWYDPKGKLRSFACRTSRISPLRMIINVPVVGKLGDKIACVFGELGALTGSISDVMDDSFMLELAMSRLAREKLARKLAWLEKKLRDPRTVDGRRDVRIIPANGHSTLTLADGSVRTCFIIDMSAS